MLCSVRWRGGEGDAARSAKEGAIGRNGRLPLEVPQRVVLVGSQGTAGHTDFLAHIAKNAWGYALMWVPTHPCKGPTAVEKLQALRRRSGGPAPPVDAVVLLRGEPSWTRHLQ